MAAVNLEQVVGHNWGLSKDTGGCLGSGDVGVVAEGEDIAILVVSQSKLININVARGCSKW